MFSPISCTTPDGPGLMLTTRRGLDELACAFRMTEPATAASRTTLLVMLSSAMRL
jgi:cation transport regulator ChaC